MITMVASFIEMAGQFLMPGLAALCRDWQVLQAVIICPFLLMLFYWVDTQWRHKTTEAYESSVVQNHNKSLRWLMATQQFEASKELILQFTHKNRMNTESDIKGVVPVEPSADSGWLHSSLLICAPLAHWLFVHSATYAPRGASFTGQEPSAEGWQQALVLLAFLQPTGTRGERTGHRMDESVHRMDDDVGMKLLSVPHLLQNLEELEKEITRRPKKVCIVKVVGTRNLWKNIVVLCVNSLTGYGIHHCFAKSMMGHEAKMAITHNFYADYYTMAGIALASCLAMCPVVGFLGRRGGLLLFMILTALASLLQLGLLNCMSDSVKDKFSVAFSIVGMFSSHAVGSLSVFFCAEITPTVIRGGGLGLVLASAGFGRLTAPIMELHNQKGYFLHHVIFACCTLICIICILLLPESKNQNLPENIPDGEHYTRQPLLPHKKGEQPLLLTNSELKDYSGLHDSAAVSDGISENTTANGMKSM
ncbi:hypothetical protein DV515_00005775 [Chloebia gouldiae]|uniref:Major facilitator superfamily (MFS) profile domain-containing protein n=1 Tax=Chloebia gouldiae TaxID=44316 RepID=A0A3L8SM79_CHLGU|nr:hypothetical protein DV515_00005775 [Chloebia gouldiae]